MSKLGFKQPRLVSLKDNTLRIRRPNPFTDTLPFYNMMQDNRDYFSVLPTFPNLVDTRLKTARYLAANYKGVLLGQKLLGILETDDFKGIAGRISAWPIQTGRGTELEVAYLVNPAVSGRGIATGVLGAVCNLADSSRTVVGLRASITPDNQGSQKVAEANGFLPTDSVEVVGGVLHAVWKRES